MVKDKVFVCERCQVRLKKEASKEATDEPGLKTVTTEWNRDLHRKLKVRYKDEHDGAKPERGLVRTSCLGLCPKERVAFEELKDGQITRTRCYPADTSEEALYELFFKS